MIGYLDGMILDHTAENVLFLVNGVGYTVESPASTLTQLPAINEKAQLFIYTHVREDAIRLFGFLRLFDKRVFQELLSVSGIGPKAALALLGPYEGRELCQLIIRNELARLTAIPGVGPKTAERILLELKSKMQKLLARYDNDSSISIAQTKTLDGATAFTSSPSSQALNLLDDLKSALLNMGYKEKQIASLLQTTEKRLKAGEELTLQLALRDSLRKLSEHVLQN